MDEQIVPRKACFSQNKKQNTRHSCELCIVRHQTLPKNTKNKKAIMIRHTVFVVVLSDVWFMSPTIANKNKKLIISCNSWQTPICR